MGERHRHGTWWPTPCPRRDLAEMSDAQPGWPVRPACAMSAEPSTWSPEPVAGRVGAPPYRRRRHSTGSAPTGPPPSPVACATVGFRHGLPPSPSDTSLSRGRRIPLGSRRLEAGRPRTLRSCLVPSSTADSSWVVRGGVGRCRRVPVRRTFTTARCPGAPCPTCRARPWCEHLLRDLRSRFRRRRHLWNSLACGLIELRSYFNGRRDAERLDRSGFRCPRPLTVDPRRLQPQPGDARETPPRRRARP